MAATPVQPATRRDAAARTTDPPPRRRDRLLAWVALAGCLLLAATGQLVDLSRPLVSGEAEALALDAALQTHRRQAQFAHEPWSWERATPYKDGLPRFDEPPGRTWLHALALSSLSENAPLVEVAYRARLVSVAFMLLAVAGVFWAGMAIGGIVTASMSALICLSTPAVLVHGRVATGDSITLGLSMFAIAAALWAIRPLRPSAALTRQAIGWTACGLALGAATLVAGANVLIYVLVPICAMLLLVPHRVGHVMGLVAAVLIAVLMVTPWAGYAHLQQPDVWRYWLAALLPPPVQGAGEVFSLAGRRLLVLLLAVAPWTLWLPSALMQPFSTSSEGSRNRLFIGWTWFLVMTMLLALAPRMGPTPLHDVLPGAAAASVMLGQLFRHGADLSAAGRHARFWRWLRFPQWGLLLALSLIVPMAGLFQTTLIERGWLDAPIVAPMHGVFWAGMAAVGVCVLLVSLGPIIRHYPARAVTWWSLWSVVMGALLAIPLARGPRLNQVAAEVDGRRVAHVARDRPVLVLTDLPRPSAVLMLYSNRPFAPVSTAQMRQLLARPSMAEGFYLLSPADYHPGERWQPAALLDAQGLRLWYCPPWTPLENAR